MKHYALSILVTIIGYAFIGTVGKPAIALMLFGIFTIVLVAAVDLLHWLPERSGNE